MDGLGVVVSFKSSYQFDAPLYDVIEGAKRPPKHRIVKTLNRIEDDLSNVMTDEELEEVSKELDHIAGIVDEEMVKKEDQKEYETDSGVLDERIEISEVRKQYLKSGSE